MKVHLELSAIRKLVHFLSLFLLLLKLTTRRHHWPREIAKAPVIATNPFNAPVVES